VPVLSWRAPRHSRTSSPPSPRPSAVPSCPFPVVSSCATRTTASPEPSGSRGTRPTTTRPSPSPASRPLGSRRRPSRGNCLHRAPVARHHRCPVVTGDVVVALQDEPGMSRVRGRESREGQGWFKTWSRGLTPGNWLGMVGGTPSTAAAAADRGGRRTELCVRLAPGEVMPSRTTPSRLLALALGWALVLPVTGGTPPTAAASPPSTPVVTAPVAADDEPQDENVVDTNDVSLLDGLELTVADVDPSSATVIIDGADA